MGVITYKGDNSEILERFNHADAVNFANEEGMNDFKDKDKVYVLGSPPKSGLLKEYIRQYRELPDYYPMDEERNYMRKRSIHGGMIGFRDVIVEEPPHRIHIDTKWENFFKRSIEYTTYDSCFRRRPYEEGTAEVVRIGFNPMGFFNGPPGRVTEFIAQMYSDEDLVKNWESIEFKKIFEDREVVKKSGTVYSLKNRYKQWRRLDGTEKTDEERSQKVDCSVSSIRKWKKDWDKIGLKY